MVRKSVESFGVVSTEDNGEVPLKTVFHSLGAIAHWVVGPDIDSTCGLIVMIDSCEVAAVASSIDNIVVGRIDGDMRRLSTGGCFPIFFRNVSSCTAVPNSNGGIVLLCSIDTIGKGIVGRDAVELSGGLVVIGTPSASPVKRNLCAPVISNDHALVVLWGDPQVVMIAMWSTMGGKCFSTIGRMMIGHVHYIYPIFVLGIGIYFTVIPCALAQGTAIVHFFPSSAPVVRAVDSAFLLVFDNGPYTLGVNRGDGNSHNS